MEIRIGFTLVSGSQGWQIPPLQYLKKFVTAEEVNLEALKSDLQTIMQYAESLLKGYNAPSKDDAILNALRGIVSEQKKLV
jgi:hypothetical protein